jgi:t-SNARE complex subunit (syntaxin)
MNSFDNYIDQTKSGLISISEDCPSNNKRNIHLYSVRNNKSNFFSKSIIKRPSELLDISKTNLEFDIQIASLKKKIINSKGTEKRI